MSPEYTSALHFTRLTNAEDVSLVRYQASLINSIHFPRTETRLTPDDYPALS